MAELEIGVRQLIVFAFPFLKGRERVGSERIVVNKLLHDNANLPWLASAVEIAQEKP